jgi:hypothetical protein
MKTLLAVAMGLMLVAAMTFAAGSLAIAAPGGHSGHGKHHPGGHHGGHWGYGPGFVVGSSAVVIGDECPTVKRCYINQFGEKRCRWVLECD